MVKCGPIGARTEVERLIVVKAARRLQTGDGECLTNSPVSLGSKV
jgi:hypothetical protein